MKTTEAKLLLTTSPFLKQLEDTPYMMRQVIYSLILPLMAAVYFFGLSALLVTLACLAGAVGSEWVITRKSSPQQNSIKDGSALLTGLLLALVLPPGIPLWMAFVGGVVSIVIGKLVFGGMGANLFNPALVGRAFLQAAFPVALTTWAPNSTFAGFTKLQGTNLAIPFLKSQVAALTSATPLAEMKFETKITDISDLLMGSTGGSLGETSALLILLSGAYLVIKNIINWRIPLSIFASAAFFAGILHWIDPLNYASPLFHLLAGGLAFGAVFMATDPVTSPITHRGCWIFGAGVGLLAVVIRTFGGLPEGVMYSILLMNAVAPLISRITHPKIYGMRGKE